MDWWLILVDICIAKEFVLSLISNGIFSDETKRPEVLYLSAISGYLSSHHLRA